MSLSFSIVVGKLKMSSTQMSRKKVKKYMDLQNFKATLFLMIFDNHLANQSSEIFKLLTD